MYLCQVDDMTHGVYLRLVALQRQVERRLTRAVQRVDVDADDLQRFYRLAAGDVSGDV